MQAAGHKILERIKAEKAAAESQPHRWKNFYLYGWMLFEHPIHLIHS
jgi:hypothetical protein